MIYFEAPTYLKTLPSKSLFLGGGITGCEDWQKRARMALEDTELIVFNPRRANYVMTPEVAIEQIKWEHYHLNLVDAILFWFSKETVQPITLFELGKWFQHKKVFVGIHPEYPRRQDVEIQLALEEELPIFHSIVYSLTELIGQVKVWEKENRNG